MIRLKLPAFLFGTLAYAFWLSFDDAGVQNVAPTTWPIAWLIFALLVMFNPLPFMFYKARWWLIRKCGKLLVSGTKPVEVRLDALNDYSGFPDISFADLFSSRISGSGKLSLNI